MADVQMRGTDPSGRPILATDYMWRWWQAVVDRLGFEPVIVQGAWMRQAGGGASASAGYHDLGGCLDLRTWNLTPDQVNRTIRTLRRCGAGAWLRDERHGMDPHIHLVLGTDADLADGAAWQWMQYVAGRDGLASGGRDYHWRPDPLVTRPPADLMEDDMQLSDEYADGKTVRSLLRRLDNFVERQDARAKAALEALDVLEQGAADDATRGQVRAVRRLVEELASESPDPS